MDTENIPVLFNLILNYFKTIEKLKTEIDLRFRSSIVPLVIIDSVLNKLSDDIQDAESNSACNTEKLSFSSTVSLINNLKLFKKKTLSKKQRKTIKQSEKFKQIIGEYENDAIKLEPKVDNRIICILNQEVKIILYF